MIQIKESKQPNLPPILRLRSLAWNQTWGKNWPQDPDYWKDNLDEHPGTVHFTLHEGAELIGAARLSYLKRLDELKYPPEVFGDVGLPDGEPFVFYSRVVVQTTREEALGINLMWSE